MSSVLSVIVQVLQPLFSQFHNDSCLLSLPFFLLFILQCTLMGREKTTRDSTLVRLRTQVGIPGHLLPVPLLYDFCIDQVSAMIQLLRKVVCRDPIHIGVPLWTDQRVCQETRTPVIFFPHLLTMDAPFFYLPLHFPSTYCLIDPILPPPLVFIVASSLT